MPVPVPPAPRQIQPLVMYEDPKSGMRNFGPVVLPAESDIEPAVQAKKEAGRVEAPKDVDADSSEQPMIPLNETPNEPDRSQENTLPVQPVTPPKLSPVPAVPGVGSPSHVS